MSKKPKTSSTRKVIFTVFQACMTEFETNTMCAELDDVYGRTAKLTGVSVMTVRRIVNEGMKNKGVFVTPGKHRKGRSKKQLDDFDLCAIRQTVHFFYTVKKEVPTLRKLRAVLKEDINFDGSYELLRQILSGVEYWIQII